MSVFGVSTNCLMDLSLSSALDKISKITDLVEIQCDGYHSLFYHGKEACDFDLRYTVHSPTGDGNIACFFEPMRKASVEAIKKTAEAADEINAEKLVIHPGFCLELKYMSEAKNAFERSIRELGEVQNEFSVRFVVENLGSLECCLFRFSDSLQLIREAGLGFCLDAGHANLNKNLDELLEMSPEHFHLHDNCGVFDEHNACGAGEIDFKKVLKKDGTFIIEVMNFENVLKSVDYLSSL